MSDNEHDPRVAVTTRIWAMATGMLAISIAMVGIDTHLAIIPVLIVMGTAISTASIWRSSRKNRSSEELASLVTVIKELQHQVARLEIESSDAELKRRIDRLHSDPLGR